MYLECTNSLNLYFPRAITEGFYFTFFRNYGSLVLSLSDDLFKKIAIVFYILVS